MEIVVCREIPKHWLTLGKNIIPEEKVVRFLPLFVEEGVIIVALNALEYISGLACPLIDLPICRHCIYQMRTTILDCNGIAVIMKPVGRHELQVFVKSFNE